MKYLNYDHSKKTVTESVGMTEEQMEDLQQRWIDVDEESDKFSKNSENIEKIEKKFNKRELAVLLNNTMKKAKGLRNLLLESTLKNLQS